MKIYLNPQRADKRIEYTFEGEVIKATYTYPTTKQIEVTTEVDGIEVPVMVENEEGIEVPKMATVEVMETLEEIFDFSDVGDGILESMEIETLPFNPVESAERVNGELHVVLINYIQSNAPHEVRFPDWLDTNDLIEPTEVVEEGVVEDGTNEVEG